MKNIALLIALLFFGNNIYSQIWNNEVICSPNPVIIRRSYKFNDSVITYNAYLCQTRSKIAVRLEVGISKYFYNPSTSKWLGQHGGPNFNLFLSYNKLNAGVKLKPWTINPKQVLDFNGTILPVTAKLNPTKIDFIIGYSLDLKRNFSLEPNIGFTRSVFEVINEEELEQYYSIPKTGGFLIGLTANKYFNFKEYEYISIFGNIAYGFVDFAKVHHSLASGYAELTLGIAYKGFLTKYFYKQAQKPSKPEITI